MEAIILIQDEVVLLLSHSHPGAFTKCFVAWLWRHASETRPLSRGHPLSPVVQPTLDSNADLRARSGFPQLHCFVP
jgi:hypothetical protein